MIYELVKDFSDVLAAMPADHPRHRILRLLEEAVRRDRQFIWRYPTTLFQCMWNLCWWHDHRGLWPKGLAYEATGIPKTVHQSKHMLSTLLEEWHGRKESRTPGFRWIRSLVPPFLPLDAGLVHQMTLGDEVTSLRFCQNQPRLVVTAGNVRIWDVDTDTVVGTLFARRDCYYRMADISPDGKLLFLFVEPVDATDFNPFLSALNIGRNTVRWRAMLDPDSILQCLAVAPSGGALAGGLRDGMIVVWDSDDGHETRRIVWPGHFVSCLSWSEDGRRLAGSYDDGTIRIWDTASGKPMMQMASDGVATSYLAWSHSDEILAAGSPSGMRFWNTKTGEPAPLFENSDRKQVAFAPTSSPIGSLSWGQDGNILAYAFGSKLIFWNRSTDVGVVLPGLHDSDRGQPLTVACSPSSAWAASAGGIDGKIVVWNTQKVKPLPKRSRPCCAAPSQNLAYYAVGFADGRVRVFSAATGGQFIYFPAHQSEVFAVAWGRGDALLASGGRDGLVKILDLWAEMEEVACLKGHASEILSLAFDPRGERIASGSSDGTARVWSVESLEEMLCLQVRPAGSIADGVYNLKFSEDGQHLITWSIGGGEGFAAGMRATWNVATGRMTHHEDVTSDDCWDGSLVCDGDELRVSHDFFESTILDAGSGKAVAWFREPLELLIKDHPTRLILARILGHSHYFAGLRLEGNGLAGAEEALN